VLRIRLQRIGRKKKPNYRIVVAEHSSAATKNKYAEQLGYYNPLASGKAFEVNTEKLLEWIKKGAKPTNTIARLLKQDGIKGMEPFIIEMRDRKKKKQEEKAETAPKEETPAPAPAEEPKEEQAPIEEKPAKEPKEEKKKEEESPKPAPSEEPEATSGGEEKKEKGEKPEKSGEEEKKE